MKSSPRLTAALGVALLLSLGGNFFLGGLVLGMPGRGGDGSFERLPRPDQAVVRKEFEGRPQIAERRAQLRAKSKAVQDALRATPFDRARLEQALAEMRQENDALRAAAHQAFAAAAAQVSPEARVRMADAPFLRRGDRDRDRDRPPRN